MIKKIKLIASDRLPTDLAARELTPEQVDKVMRWLTAQTIPIMDRADIEAQLQSIGFSPNEINGIVVSLVKESVRPHLGFYFILILLIFATLAICLR